MSGHSKWHNIQKTKGAQDAKRAAAFTKISKEMIVAVKEGGGIADPAYNSRLATVITKAKAANMPNDNIKRVLEKAAASGSGDNYETITYEGHGPCGVAVIVETMTDTDPDDINTVAKALEDKGYKFDSAQIEMVPQTYQKLEKQEDRDNMEKMLDLFEDDDDVQNVWHNWDQE